MIESEIDMDELETRLYGQVHYMPSDYDNFVTPPNVPNTQHVPSFTRYFDNTKSQHLNKISPNELINVPSAGMNRDCDRLGVYSVPVMHSPVNNIVLLPPPPTQIYTHQRNSQKWLERLLCQYKKARSKNNRRRSLSNKSRQNSQKQQNQIANIKINVDSNAPEIKREPTNHVKEEESVCVISDDDANASKDSGDVILVESKHEVINIDCEETEQTVINNSTENLDLESTTSNDFLDNSIISNIKKSSPIKKCETSSGRSSSMDYTENFKGHTSHGENVNPANNTFSKLNLDSFTNYIESSGKKSDDFPPLQSSLSVNKSKKHSLPEKENVNSSDSSSESDCNSELEYELQDLINDNQVFGEVINLDDSQSNVGLAVNDSVKVDKEMAVIEIDESFDNHDASIIYVDDFNDPSLKEDNHEHDLIINVDGVDDKTENSNNQPKGFSKYWTDDMNKFYNSTWGQENFNIAEEQKNMSDDPNMWKIVVQDRVNLNLKSREPRCRRCREFGHISINCNKVVGPIRCIICGDYGHKETRCNKQICTSCGLRNSFYTTYCSRCARVRHVRCHLCSMAGHMHNSCPDLWRRFLFTTNEGPLQQPPVTMFKAIRDRWCSGCSSNGHFESDCHYYNRSHASVSLLIHSYENIYGIEGNNVENATSTPSSFEKPIEVEEHDVNKNISEEVSKRPKIVDQTQTIHLNEPSTSGTSKELWSNDDPIYIALMNRDTSIFLSVLREITSVSTNVSREGSNKIICNFKGTTENIINAKAAVTRYCLAMNSTIKRVKKPLTFMTTYTSRDTLQRNLNLLNESNRNWFRKAKKLFANITGITSLIHKCVKHKTYQRMQYRLKQFYEKLNTIIIGKLRIGDGKTHMDILEQCLQNNKISLYSFDYVFHSDHSLYPNYEELISKLPRPTPNVTQNNSTLLKLENLKLACLKLCKKLKLKIKHKILRLYAQVIISDYSTKYVSVFQQQCLKINKIRMQKNQVQKNNRTVPQNK